MNFKLLLGIIGIALIAYDVLAMLPLPVPSMLNAIWMLGGSQDTVIMSSIFLLTLPTGLMLYIIGRKEISSQNTWVIGVFQIKPSGLLMFFGLILTALSLWVLGWLGAFMQSDFAGPRTSRDWTIYLLLSAWSGLGVMSGVLCLIDGARMGEDKALPLKKEIDLGSQTKYPKDLLAKYMKQYPHNPTGVIEWHIDKKMKEGKTREQAIKELENIGDGTI